MSHTKFIHLLQSADMLMRQIAVTLFLLSFPAAWAANGDSFTVTTAEGVKMQFSVISESAKTCQVRGQYFSAIPNSTKGAVTIPETANGYKVVTIGKDAFLQCRSITTVSIPITVTSIEDNAFSDCDELTSLFIPKSVTKLGSSTNSFMNVILRCGKLSSLSVESGNPVFESPNNCNAIIEKSTHTLVAGCSTTIIPSSVTIIRESAFSGCSGLKQINVPYGVTTIGTAAFMGCTGLEKVTLPGSLKSIQQHSFTQCSSLESITIPKSTSTYIGVNAFSDCSNLKYITVESGNSRYDSRENCNAIIETRINTLIVGCGNSTIPSTVTSIGFNAFNNCQSLKSLVIPSNVTNIEKDAFNYCGLTSLKIMNGQLTTLNSSAFYTCHDLRSIELPASISSIKDDAFYGCDSIETITVDSANPVYDSRNGCNAVIETATNTLILGTKNTVIPNDVTAIGKNAFIYGTMEKLVIPESVRKMDAYSVAFCYELKNLTFKGDLPEEIASNCFSGVGMQTPCTLTVPLEYLDHYANAFVNDKFYSGTFTLRTPAEPVCLAEYFVNDDPGIGKAHTVYATGDDVEIDISADEMDTGINVIGFRPAFRNAEEEIIYGATTYRYAYRPAADGRRDIERIEYFWDEDPGKGNGVAIAFQTSGESAVVDCNIDYRSLCGAHVLCIRALSQGVWSNLYQQTVLLPEKLLSGDITLDPDAQEDAANGVFSMLGTLFTALSTRGFDAGLNVHVADAIYGFQVSEQSIAVVQALYQYLISTNFYVNMKAQQSATFNFTIPADFIYSHASELPQIVMAVQALFSHIVTENISILINGQPYRYDGFQVEPNDLLALKNLYNRLDGENWTQKRWSFLSNGRDKDELPGVTFNEQGRVVSIDLSGNNLRGILSSEWELNLPFLTYLQLSRNDIEGDLSPFLRGANSLTSLYMSFNCLSEISDTLPGSLQTIDLTYQFKTGYSNSELKDSLLARQSPRRFYISNSQQLSLPSLFTYNHKYRNHSSTPTVYLLDRTAQHNSFAYYTSQYGFAWKSSEEYTDRQDARYLAELSGGTANYSVFPLSVRYVEGDADMSGATDVLDVQHTLNHILGSVWNFNRSAANTYADNLINIQDIVCTVNLLLSNEQQADSINRQSSRERRTFTGAAQAWLYTKDGRLMLAAGSEIGALDIELFGVSTSQVSLLLNHAHFQMIGRNTRNGSRYVIFSPSGQPIPAGEACSLLRLAAPAEIAKARIADVDAREVGILIGQEPTSIAQVAASSLSARLSGSQLIVSSGEGLKGLELRLMSMGGAVVFHASLSSVARGETAVGVSLLPGVYVLEMTAADRVRKTLKLTKR